MENGFLTLELVYVQSFVLLHALMFELYRFQSFSPLLIFIEWALSPLISIMQTCVCRRWIALVEIYHITSSQQKSDVKWRTQSKKSKNIFQQQNDVAVFYVRAHGLMSLHAKSLYDQYYGRCSEKGDFRARSKRDPLQFLVWPFPNIFRVMFCAVVISYAPNVMGLKFQPSTCLFDASRAFIRKISPLLFLKSVSFGRTGSIWVSYESSWSLCVMVLVSQISDVNCRNGTTFRQIAILRLRPALFSFGIPILKVSARSEHFDIYFQQIRFIRVCSARELFLKKVENRDSQKILSPEILAELGSTSSMYNTDRDTMSENLFEVSSCYIKVIRGFQRLSDSEPMGFRLLFL